MNVLIALLILAAPPDAELDQARAEFKKAVADLSASAVQSAADRLAATDQKVATDALFDGYGKPPVAIKPLWGHKVKPPQEREPNGDYKIDLKTTPPPTPASDVKKYERFLEADKQSKATESKIGNVEACK